MMSIFQGTHNWYCYSIKFCDNVLDYSLHAKHMLQENLSSSLGSLWIVRTVLTPIFQIIFPTENDIKCGSQSNSPNPCRQDVHVGVSRHYERVQSYSKWGIEVAHWLILTWGEYPGLPRWAQLLQGSLKAEEGTQEESQSDTTWEGLSPMLLASQVEEWGCAPRKVSRL